MTGRVEALRGQLHREHAALGRAGQDWEVKALELKVRFDGLAAQSSADRERDSRMVRKVRKVLPSLPPHAQPSSASALSSPPQTG